MHRMFKLNSGWGVILEMCEESLRSNVQSLSGSKYPLIAQELLPATSEFINAILKKKTAKH